jgi:mRNA-degrading endonuclease toxin of MazEF toxin-antitoxin module
MRRGDVWWVDFPPPTGRRPAVLISRAEAYRARTALTVVPLTRTIRSIAVEVRLGRSDGVPQDSVANADSIATVPKASILTYICSLPREKVEALERAIKFALDLP